MKKLAICITLLMCAGRLVFSQEKLNELTVDRPGVAETPYTVLPKHYQFEIGFDYFERPAGKVYNLPIILFRTGLNEKMELRLSSRHVVDKTMSNYYDGVSPFSVGIKRHVVKQKKWIPEVDVLANLVVPLSPSVDQSAKLGYDFLLLFQNDFYSNSALNYNIGYLWDHVRGTNAFTISACYNYLPFERVNFFVEYFCFVPDGWWGEQGVDTGVTFLAVDNVQLDLSAGYSLLEGNSNYFVSSGVSFRLE